MPTAGSPGIAWLASLSPWPVDGFGLERMQMLLADLGHPEREYEAVHIVGTNGKSSAAGPAAELFRTAMTSPTR
jgi:dihydrofolate synthase/folylpolyglutamate synthase